MTCTWVDQGLRLPPSPSLVNAMVITAMTKGVHGPSDTGVDKKQSRVRPTVELRGFQAQSDHGKAGAPGKIQKHFDIYTP